MKAAAKRAAAPCEAIVLEELTAAGVRFTKHYPRTRRTPSGSLYPPRTAREGRPARHRAGRRRQGAILLRWKSS